MKKIRLLGEFFDHSVKVILLCVFFSGILIILGSPKASADDPFGSTGLQQRSVSGVISDENGNAKFRINIQIEGTTIGLISDNNGRFSITVPNQNAVLIVSFVGYNTQRIPVGGRTSFNVSLVPSTAALEEVIVVGYGTQRKADLTGQSLLYAMMNISSTCNQS